MRPASWRESEPPRADFFAAKAVLAALLRRAARAVERRAAREPFLHPGRSARVLIGGERAGWLGEIHPAVARAWDIDGGAAGFELDLGADRARGAVRASLRGRHLVPAVLQDRAWWFAADVPAADVLAAVREAGGALLRHAEVFDVYPAEGRVSLALRLEFRAADRTLTDEEVAQRRAKIDAAWPSASGASRVAETVAVLGAAGYAGALAARCCTATRTSSSRT